MKKPLSSVHDEDGDNNYADDAFKFNPNMDCQRIQMVTDMVTIKVQMQHKLTNVQVDNPTQWNDTDGDGYGDNSKEI